MLNLSRARIFWRLSRVSFQDIITMKTTEPIFDEGGFARLFLLQNPHEKPGVYSGASANPAPLESNSQDPPVHQEVRTQGASLNRISSSVNELRDTMTELKNAFTALQTELNTYSRCGPDVGRIDNSCDMLMTVLKELKVKSDEIERLKLEKEVLRLKMKFLEDRDTKSSIVITPHLQTRPMAIGEACSPSLMTGNTKRTWPETLGTDQLRHIADSPNANNVLSDDSSLADITMQSIKVPVKDTSNFPKISQAELKAIPMPPLRENGPSANSVVGVVIHDQLNIQQPATKRRRLSLTDDFQTLPIANEEKKRGRGRPRGSRKSMPTPLEEQDVNAGSGVVEEENIAEGSNPKRLPSRNRSRRGRSRAPSTSTAITRSARGKDIAQNAIANTTASTTISAHRGSPGPAAEQHQASLPTQQTMEASSHTSNNYEKENREDGSANKLRRRETQEKRKAQRAARDAMAKLAMEREEALAMASEN